MHHQQKPAFSPLHLEHNEYLLENFAAELVFGGDKMRMPGRVFVGTSSISFEPSSLATTTTTTATTFATFEGSSSSLNALKESMPISIKRFPFKFMPLEPSLTSTTTTIVIHFTKFIEQFSDCPYRTVETSPPPPSSSSSFSSSSTTTTLFNFPESSCLLAPKHLNANKLITLLKTLHSISLIPQPILRSRAVLKDVVDPRMNEGFDRSRLVDFTERVIVSAQAERIDSLFTQPGNLVLTNARIYFQPVRLNQLGAGAKGAFAHDFSAIRRVAPKRYMMSHRGLMLVFAVVTTTNNSSNNTSASNTSSSSTEDPDGNDDDENREEISYLFAFRNGPEARDEFLAKLRERGPNVARKILAREEALRTALARWQSREIDNYGYLRALNELADRSTLDLAQYPVYPWVVADYDSPELDLSAEPTFRDLSKPIGALNPERLKQLEERMAAMGGPVVSVEPEDEGGERVLLNDGVQSREAIEGGAPPPPFLYGSHYSTPGFVLFYLLRERPLEMLHLQSGRFDATERMFHSVRGAWRGVLGNPSDVKELIPEFYEGNGEFLVNSRGLDLWAGSRGEDLGGARATTTTTHRRLGDVELPPWAHGSPREFVRKMRAALESDYVSARLPAWIDLIFGCKQRSRRAKNLFFHITYEGSVNLDAVSPAERAALEVQIMEFGQTPTRLFRKAHPARDVASFAPSPASSPFAADVAAPQARLPLREEQKEEEKINGGEVERGEVFNEEEEEEDDDDQRTTTTHHVKMSKRRRWELIGEFVESKHSLVWRHEWIETGGGGVNGVWIEEDVYCTACRDGSLAIVRPRGHHSHEDAALEPDVRRVRLSKLALTCVGGGAGPDCLYLGSADDGLCRYSPQTGRVLGRVDNAHEDTINSIHVSLPLLVTGGADSAVRLWDAARLSSPLCSFYALEEPVGEVHLGAVTGEVSNRTLLAALGADTGRVVLHDWRARPQPVWDSPGEGGGRGGVRWLDGSSRRVVVAATRRGGIRVLDMRKGAGRAAILARTPSTSEWGPTALETDGRWLVVGDNLGRVTGGGVEGVENLAFESSVMFKCGSPITSLCVRGEIVASASQESARVGLHYGGRGEGE